MKITLSGNFTISTSRSGYSLDEFIPTHLRDKGEAVKECVRNISYPSSVESAVKRYSELYYEDVVFEGIPQYVDAIQALTRAVENQIK